MRVSRCPPSATAHHLHCSVFASIFVVTQLGLQMQVGHDVSAVKDSVRAVEEGMHLFKASLCCSRTCTSYIFQVDKTEVRRRVRKCELHL